MSKISLCAEGVTEVTIVPNIFIDCHMPSASGAYVKVYLYLLRCLNSDVPDVTISSLAEHLEDSEKDIIRALNYWEKQKLLTLVSDENKDITSIRLNELSTQAAVDYDRKNTDSELDEIAVSIHTGTKPVVRQSYSASRINELTNNDDIRYTMHVVELYLDRPLKPMDIQLILYLYEELHFSAELIMYLYEYCVSRNKKSPSYIEAVALTWAENGIDTEEKAKEATSAYNEHFNAVNKAFGMNRAPGQIERQFIRKWVEVFTFSDDIITEACNRTILRTGKPDFKYTDKILETWYKKGVKTMADVVLQDEEFSRSSKRINEVKVTPITKTSANKFNQFPQREYTSRDYAELEKKLLNKGM